MAKDALEQFCDLEQSLPKTTICKRNIQNGYITITTPKRNNDFIGIRKIDNNTPIVIDDDDDEIEEKSTTTRKNVEENGFPGFSKTGNLSNGAFQLAVLREVEFNINDVDKANVNKVSTEVKRRPGRPKGYVMKKKETVTETHVKSNTESDDGSEKKNFSLRLGFLGPYQKHKTKTKRDKPSGYSTEDSSPASKKRCGRPMTINVDDENEENSQSNNAAIDAISVRSSSEANSPIDNKINDIDSPEKDEKKIDLKNIKENKSSHSSQANEKIINVKPITLEPRRRMGRPRGPPKPPKIRGKRGRKPNPNKVLIEKFKSEKNVENSEPKIPKIPGRRGRPKLYPERPPKIKIPGRKVGRPPGPPKPFKPKGPRGRPRLIRINTSDRPYNHEYKNSNEELDDKRVTELKMENSLTIKTLPAKKRGRPLGYSPIGKTKKRLGRPPAKSRGFRSKRGKIINIVARGGGRGRGRGRGRPRKYPIKIDENNPMNNERNYELTKSNNSTKSDDECSDISVTDKNWETVVEDSQNDSETSSQNENGNDSDSDDDNDDSSSEDEDDNIITGV